jgi:hypothetical protein
MNHLRQVYVVSPHRDDAALSLACWLDLLARRDDLNLALVNCFTHSAWAPNSPKHGQGAAVTRIRADEDARFREFLGADEIDLGLCDTSMRAQPCPVFEFDAHAQTKLIASVATLLGPHASSDPNAAWVLPLGLGGHVDHYISNAAGLAVTARLPGEPARAVALYPEVPYSLETSPDELRCSLLAAERALACGFRQLEVEHSDPVATWYGAARFYHSQFSEREVMGMLALMHRRGGERLWVNAAFDAISSAT